MNKYDEVQQVMVRMFGAVDLGSRFRSSPEGKCECGRITHGLEPKCLVCLTHDLSQHCSRLQAQRFMLKLKELRGVQETIRWEIENGQEV